MRSQSKHILEQLSAALFFMPENPAYYFCKHEKYPQRKELKIMDNEKRTLIVDTFDDLISMNGDYDTQKLTVKFASCKFSVEYVRDILATLHNLEQ